MPTINIPQRKSSIERNEHTASRELRRKAYNNTAWRKLRDTYLKEHPLCEECSKKGKLTPAEDIHHKISPFKNGSINYDLLLDYNNLESICKTCHGLEHSNAKNKLRPEDVLKQLEDLFNNNIPDEYFE